LTYDALRTGVTFREVASWLWVGTADRTQWRQKTRHTVLGKWHEFKLECWNAHVNSCTEEPYTAVDQADGAGSLVWRALPWVAAGGALVSVLS
jgi:hypothetical protein